jgi:acetyl-CoA carboxylase biotin carboxyl carrier protein
MPKKQVLKNKKKELGSLEELKKIYDFMVSNKLEFIEYCDGKKQIKLVRKSSQNISAHTIPVFSQIPATATQIQNIPQTSAKSENIAPGETIKSPMSGIFYRAPSPSSPPYVREGDEVKEGQVICIVEAMKVFNEIKAEFNFKVKKVLIENGKPISVNQDIFLIERI